MRFEQLKCIVAIAETGTITAAAKRMFISQQAVSANIKQLEDELQCKLLVREKDGVSLTPQGKETVVFAQKMLEEKEEFCSRISLPKQTELLVVRVCSTSSVTNIVLPDVLDRLEAKEQKITLKITMEDEIDELFERVNNNQCDIGLLTFNANELVERFDRYQNEMRMEVLVRDELISVVNKKFLHDEPLKLSREEFDSRRQSLYNIIPSKQHLSSAQKGTTVWSNDSEFHRAMLERSGTMVLMPSLAYQYFFSSKKYIALPIEHLEVPLIHAAVYRKDAPSYIQEFVNLIRLEMHMK